MATEWMSQAKPLFVGGLAGGIGGYAYDRFIAAPVRGAIGSFAGNWTDAVGSFGVALLLRKFAGGKAWVKDAGLGMFSHELAVALETNLPGLGGGGSSSAATAGGTWYAQALARAPGT
jgi:hypothetical protein